MKNLLWCVTFFLSFIGLFSLFVLSPLDSKWVIVAIICGIIASIQAICLTIYELKQKENNNERK